LKSKSPGGWQISKWYGFGGGKRRCADPFIKNGKNRGKKVRPLLKGENQNKTDFEVDQNTTEIRLFRGGGGPVKTRKQKTRGRREDKRLEEKVPKKKTRKKGKAETYHTRIRGGFIGPGERSTSKKGSSGKRKKKKIIEGGSQ